VAPTFPGGEQRRTKLPSSPNSWGERGGRASGQSGQGVNNRSGVRILISPKSEGEEGILHVASLKGTEGTSTELRADLVKKPRAKTKWDGYKRENGEIMGLRHKAQWGPEKIKGKGRGISG